MLVAILVISPHDLHALILIAHQGSKGGLRGATHGITEGLCDFFDRCADGPEAGVQDFAWGKEGRCEYVVGTGDGGF